MDRSTLGHFVNCGANMAPFPNVDRCALTWLRSVRTNISSAASTGALILTLALAAVAGCSRQDIFALSDAATAASRERYGLSVLALNLRGIHDVPCGASGARWQDRYSRIATFMKTAGIRPDVIAIQELPGWIWCPTNHHLLNDYEAADTLLTFIGDIMWPDLPNCIPDGYSSTWREWIMRHEWGPQLGRMPSLWHTCIALPPRQTAKCPDDGGRTSSVWARCMAKL